MERDHLPSMRLGEAVLRNHPVHWQLLHPHLLGLWPQWTQQAPSQNSSLGFHEAHCLDYFLAALAMPPPPPTHTAFSVSSSSLFTDSSQPLGPHNEVLALAHCSCLLTHSTPLASQCPYKRGFFQFFSSSTLCQAPVPHPQLSGEHLHLEFPLAS